jgi:hypothetical protein
MGRLAHSWHLFKTSMGVIKQDKELLWMPVLSFLASAVAIMGVAGIGFGSGLFPEVSDPERPMAALLGFAMYLVLAFITLFFTAAVVAGATERLAGGDPTVGSALKAAWAKKGKIFLWSIVVATVNVILQAIRERSGMLGQILSGIAGFAWNVATFFMVPVLLFEDKGVGQSLRQSGGLFKKTWGETVVGEAGIGFLGGIVTVVLMLLGFLLIMMLAPLGPVGVIAGVAIVVVALVFNAILFSTVAGVYKAALYRYATTGTSSGGFEPGDLGGAFHPKPTA